MNLSRSASCGAWATDPTVSHQCLLRYAATLTVCLGNAGAELLRLPVDAEGHALAHVATYSHKRATLALLGERCP